MTKKEFILEKWWSHGMIDRKEATIQAMEEYGKYCAEQAWDSCFKNSDVISFNDWWNEFKAKEYEKQN